MELQTNPHNPRTISKDAYEKLKRSIERNPDGLTANKIAYKDGIIISGNQRYRAILELGLTIKPEWLKDLSGWTQEQIDEWVIQSNISAGEWDWDILANEWDEDELDEWGLNIPGKNDADAEWVGMPEYASDNQGPYRQIVISFNNDESVREFAELLGQTITNKTKSLWFPMAVQGSSTDEQYI
jgi:hypothetical protein